MRETHQDDFDEVLNAVSRVEILGQRKLVAERDAQIEILRKRTAPESLAGVAALYLPRVGFARLVETLRKFGQIVVLFQQINALRQSEYCGPVWYADTYHDCGSPHDAAHHDLHESSARGHDPGPNSSTNSYSRANTDLAAVGWPALSHGLLHGKAEGWCATHETGL